jgi:hypothetical protein
MFMNCTNGYIHLRLIDLLKCRITPVSATPALQKELTVTCFVGFGLVLLNT